MSLLFLLASIALLAGIAPPAFAGKARDYLNAPVNTWVTFYNAAYARSVSPVVGGAEFGVPEVATDVVSQSVIISRIIDVWGRTGGLSLIVPHAAIESSGGSFRAADSAVGDLAFAAEVNLFGAPALSKDAFREWTPETFSSIHFVLSAPTGSYDPSSPVSVGSNRWSLTSTINYSYTPDAGRTWLEAYASVRSFSANHDPPGTASRLEQRPLLQFEAHASRNVTPDLWLSADLYYDWGGETFVDDVGQNNAANTLRLGAGLGVRIPKVGQLMLNADRVVAAPVGQPDGYSLRLSLARVW